MRVRDHLRAFGATPSATGTSTGPLLFQDVKCRPLPGDAAGNGRFCTDYDFTDYDLYGMAMGWWTMAQRKDYCGPAGDFNKVVDENVAALYSQAAAQEVPFCRENPKNWYAELMQELMWMRALEAISKMSPNDPALRDASGAFISPTGMMMILMNKMIQYKARLKDQWILKVPGLLEVGDPSRVNGRHQYAVARAGYAPIYFYVLEREAWRYRNVNTINNPLQPPHGSLNYSLMSGRIYTEPNYPGRYVPKADPDAGQIVLAAAEVIASAKNIQQGQGPSISSISDLVNLFADADRGPLRMQAPLNLLEPPQSTAQEVLTGVKTAAMAIAQFATLMYSMFKFAAGGGDGTAVVNTNIGDAVMKLVQTGNVGTAMDGGMVTQLAGQATTMILATEGVFYTSLTNQMLTNSLDAILFSEGWDEIYAAAALKARELESERARLAREGLVKDEPGKPPDTAPAASGGLTALLAGAAAGFLLGGPAGAGVGAVVAAVARGKSASAGTPTTPVAPVPTISSWVGSWDTADGLLVLRQTGNSIAGTFERDEGVVAGIVLANGELKLNWAKTGPSQGTMQARLAPDGKTFLGTWKVTGSNNSGVWAGTKRT